jgi:hypothetical protein
MDITKLEGYKPEMTAEEKLALIEKYEPDLSGFVKKDLFDKASSTIADLKKQLQAKMTDDEQKEAKRAEEAEKIRVELENLRKEKSISESKAKFLGLGYDDALATETAKALADGDMEKVFGNQAIHLENVKKAATAAKLADESVPPAGQGASLEDQKELEKTNKIRQAAGLPPKES